MGFVEYNGTFRTNKYKSEEVLKDFKFYLQENGRKPRTIQRSIDNIYRVITHTKRLSKDEINRYFGELKDNGRKNTYINGMVGTIRVYARFKRLRDELVHLKFRKEDVPQVSTMSDNEIESLVNMECPRVAQRHRTGKMMMRRSCPPEVWNTWSLFFKIMAFTGMRPGEVAFLKLRDIDWGRGVFIIEDSKTNTPGLAPIPPNIFSELEAFLEKKNLEQDGYLFPSRFGGNHDGVTPVFDNVDWHYAFHKRLDLLGIKRPNLKPYSLRHSFATTLLETEGVDIADVKKLMRHKDIKTTLIYEHLTTKDMINTIKKLPLVRKGSDPANILQLLISAVKSFEMDKDTRFEFTLKETQNSVSFSARIVPIT